MCNIILVLLVVLWTVVFIFGLYIKFKYCDNCIAICKKEATILAGSGNERRTT